MWQSPAPWLAALAMVVLDAGTAEARREAMAFAVGAVVPAPSCVASTTQRALLAVTCSGTVSFIAQAAPLPSDALRDMVTPSLTVSLVSEAGRAVMRRPTPRRTVPDALLITVIY
jgi:hypothetical protein